MARDWDSLFSNWVDGFSETTEGKAENALRLIRDAISSSATLKGKDVRIYPTGSYHNNTNTKLESDVDVAVVLADCWFSKYPATGQPQAVDLGYSGASYGLSEFRDDVGCALIKKFGAKGVSSGQKAFDVHENTYRVDADVAVFLQHRRFSGRKTLDGSWHYDEGAELRPRNDATRRIVNWHDPDPSPHSARKCVVNPWVWRRAPRGAPKMLRIPLRFAVSVRSRRPLAPRDERGNRLESIRIRLTSCLLRNEGIAQGTTSTTSMASTRTYAQADASNGLPAS